MSTAALKRLAWRDYVELERSAAQKHEYYDGELFAMAGGTANHSVIAGNVIGEARNALKSSGCRVHTSDMRVLCPSGLGTYPDCSIACGEPEYLDERQDTLLNPVVIFEVLSPSTEAYDRGKKFEHYESLASLREYVVVSQDQMRVEHFARQSQPGEWLRTVVNDPAQSLALPTLGISLSLAELYAKVAFDESSDGANS